MNQGFCERCIDLFKLETLRKLSGQAYRHGQAQTIVRSAFNGCPFCGLMCHVKICEVFGFPDGAELVESDPEDWVLVHVQSGTEESLIDSLEVQIEGEKERGYCRAFAAEGDPSSTLTSFRPIETDVASQTVVSAARQLISSCRNTHPACRAATEVQPPTRVLDVSRSNGAFVSLCSGHDLKSEDYVALSYCWGGDQPLKLTSSNMTCLENGISFTLLPLTLQDAVTCTNALGYRYLWVDALCIMQDSESDKLKEIANMASIYRNAAVTITAVVASSVSEGYLDYNRLGSVSSKFEASKSKIGHCHVDIEIEDGRVGTLTIIPKVEGRNTTRSMPLNKRGWCLQESMLPRRLLYYGPQELLFRCQTIDCQPVIPSVIEYTKGVDPPRILSAEIHDLNRKRLWYNIVHDFSFRQVSVAEDRVHALGGVINELEKKWEDECIFGIWKSRLLEDLCWVSMNESLVERSRHAPSWSWMSLNSGIEVNYKDFENVDAMLHDISGKIIHLTCRIMTKSHPSRGKIGYSPDFKLTSDEPDGKHVDYLYIGPARWNDIIMGNPKHANIAIAAIEIEDSVFRRVGLVTQNIHREHGVGTSTWVQALPKRIRL
ncbi:heterokaryon incompatibility protein-domain-containing protein, partial [Hypoxylon cercidicola]